MILRKQLILQLFYYFWLVVMDIRGRGLTKTMIYGRYSQEKGFFRRNNVQLI